MLNKDGTLLGRPPLLKPQPLMDSNMSTTQTAVPDFLQRMIVEQIELNNRYVALSKFLSTGVKPETMSDLSWKLLHDQSNAMESYRDILIERIDLALRETTTN